SYLASVIFSSQYQCVFFISFFFQAEDGIRDRNVTGVQTCALPIFLKESGDRFQKTIIFCVDEEHAARMRQALVNENADLVAENRSEERRVGKECRARWAAED